MDRRLLVAVWVLLLGTARAIAADEPGTDVIRLVAMLESPSAAEREEADLRLRNLPLSAYPAVERFVADAGDRLPPETAARLQGQLRAFKALAAWERRRTADRDWEIAMSLRAYDHLIDGAPAWRAAGRRAVEVIVREIREPRPSAELLRARQTALDARCDNPVFRYFDSIVQLQWLATDVRTALEALHAAAVELTRQGSECPITLQYQASWRYYRFIDRDVTLAPVAAAKARLPRPESFFFRLKPDDDVSPFYAADMAGEAYRKDTFDRDMTKFPKYEKHLASVTGDEYNRLMIRGFAHRTRANDDPRLKRNPPDPEDPQARRARHLTEARKWYEEARKLEPDHPAPLTQLMFVAIDAGDGEEAYRLLKRTLEAYPDAHEACAILANSLNFEDRVLLARRLAAGKNYRGRVPYVLIDAHIAIADATAEKREYWARPDVWNDVRSVFIDALLLYPDDNYVRSSYANLAAKCEQWTTADAQFKILGDRADVQVFGGMATYNYLRKKAARMVEAAGQ